LAACESTDNAYPVLVLLFVTQVKGATTAIGRKLDICERGFAQIKIPGCVKT